MSPQLPKDVILRRIRDDELPQLLDLYRHLHVVDAPLPAPDQLAALWQAIRRDPNLLYVVAELGGQLVSSCALAVVPNLTRGGRPYAVIENVVTHADHRRRGLGTAVLRYAIEAARSRTCYKIMLLTGSKRPETLRFYERVGFLRNARTGFVMPLG